jgi:hypothetical protein
VGLGEEPLSGGHSVISFSNVPFQYISSPQKFIVPSPRPALKTFSLPPFNFQHLSVVGVPTSLLEAIG